MGSDDERSALDALIDDVTDITETDESEELVDGGVPDADANADSDADSDLGGELSGELGELEAALAERDTYLADSQRLAAEFANFRKQSEKRAADSAATQSAGLVKNLLPVLDACDSALGQDPDSVVGPIRSALLGELERSGLELVSPETGAEFDPELHEAVMHEAAEDDSNGPTIGELLRAGYSWKGRVVRPAMVKVIG